MSEPTICAHCKNAEDPLTPENSQEIFQNDSDAKKVPRAYVHLTCARAWALAHGGILDD
jgi:hypothetical protein